MKNLKANLMYLLNLVFGVLIYVFLSQSYIDLSASIGGYNEKSQVANGYDIIANYFEGSGTEVMMALSNLVVAILAGVLILASIYCMLVSFGVVKKSKAIGAVNFLNIILSIALAVMAAISLFCTVGELDGLSSGGTGFTIGWAVIVNFVVTVITIVTSILASKFSKK